MSMTWRPAPQLLPNARPMRVHWVRGWRLALHPFLWGHPRRAYVLWPGVCWSRIEPEHMAQRHLAHEYAHCLQLWRSGVLRGWGDYVVQWLGHGGYSKQLPMEREADDFAMWYITERAKR